VHTTNIEERDLPRLQEEFELSRCLDLFQEHQVPGVPQDAVHHQLLADVLAPTPDLDVTVEPRQALRNARGPGLPLGAFHGTLRIGLFFFYTGKHALVDLILPYVFGDRVKCHQLLLREAGHQDPLQLDKRGLLDMLWLAWFGIALRTHALNMLIYLLWCD
jgi:hypothetical protein